MEALSLERDLEWKAGTLECWSLSEVGKKGRGERESPVTCVIRYFL